MAITFTAPMKLKPEAVKVEIRSFGITQGRVLVRLEYVDSAGEVIEAEDIEFTGADHDEIVNAAVKPSHAGMKLSQALRRLVQAKVKQKKNFSGTED